MTLHFTDLSRILFMDIETAPQFASFDQLDVRLQGLWQKKITQTSWFSRHYDNPSSDNIASSYQEKAGIYAEFSKIICISAGFIEQQGLTINSFRLKSFFDDDESALLRAFIPVLTEHYYNPSRHYLCGHNLKEFDIPFLCRRLIVNHIPLPKMIDVAGQKPWQTKQFIDTLEQWKFGDYKNYTSLDLIAAALDIPSPKTNMDGSQVAEVYYKDESGLEKIMRYCEQDVITVARVFLAMQHKEAISDDMISSTTVTKEAHD